MTIQSDEKKKNTAINLQEILKKTFGFDQFKGEQEAIIRSILGGKDTFVIMPTGGGKSLCYQLPAMILDGMAIVVSPLIASHITICPLPSTGNRSRFTLRPAHDGDLCNAFTLTLQSSLLAAPSKM